MSAENTTNRCGENWNAYYLRTPGGSHALASNSKERSI